MCCVNCKSIHAARLLLRGCGCCSFADPIHLVVGFESLGDALAFCHLPRQQVEHLICLPIGCSACADDRQRTETIDPFPSGTKVVTEKNRIIFAIIKCAHCSDFSVFSQLFDMVFSLRRMGFKRPLVRIQSLGPKRTVVIYVK